MNKQTDARERLERLSLGLARTFGPEPAAHLLTGAALNALLPALGRDGTAKYLRLLSDEIDAELPPDDAQPRALS
jgi:hypothetical protein